MDFINEANLDYEAEIKRNPQVIRTWVNYISDSASASHQVCSLINYSISSSFLSFGLGYTRERSRFFRAATKFGLHTCASKSRITKTHL